MNSFFFLFLVAVTSLFMITIGGIIQRFVKTKNFTYLQIAVILFFAFLKIFSDFVWSGTVSLPVSPNLIFSFGNFCGAFSLFLFTQFISKNWFPLEVRFLQKILNGTTSVILLGFAIDVLRPGPVPFLSIENNPSPQIRGNWIFITFLYLFFFLLIIYFISVSRSLKNFPTTLVPVEARRVYRWIFFLIGAGLAFGLSTLLLIPATWTFWYLFFLYSSHLAISVAVFLVFLLIRSNPLMIFNSKANIEGMVQKGIVGWGLFGFIDDGPTAFQVSKPLLDKYGITEAEILALSVSLMTVSGLNQSFDEVTFAVPFPSNKEESRNEMKDNLMILCTSFSHNDPTIEDKRMGGRILAVFTLFVPRFLVFTMSNFNSITPLVKETAHSTKTIHQMNQKEVLDQLTVEILKQVL